MTDGKAFQADKTACSGRVEEASLVRKVRVGREGWSSWGRRGAEEEGTRVGEVVVGRQKQQD